MRIKGKISVTVHPSFIIVAVVIGLLFSRSLAGALLWLVVVFVSILVHELGHALTALACKQHPRIELVAMGGVTYYEGRNLSFAKKFLIVLNGPLFGFLLFLIASYLAWLPSLAALAPFFLLLQGVNLFWTIVNLLPVMPLDGGQLVRVVLERFMGVRGLRYSFLVSAVFAVLCSLFFFFIRQMLPGAFFFLFAYQNYDSYRSTRSLVASDTSDELKVQLAHAEKVLADGDKQKAITLFADLRSKASQGMIYSMASQYLAFLESERGHRHEAFLILKDTVGELAPDAISLLHTLAFEEKDFSLVKNLASECFQIHPSVDTAVRYACAEAIEGNALSAIGWIEAAREEGLENMVEVIAMPYFDPIRSDPAFVEWRAKSVLQD